MEALTSKNNETNQESTFFVQVLDLVLAEFPKRSQEIIRSRYGIDGKGALTLEEIGKKYTITRERVRQVIREVFRKVKDKQNASSIKEVREKLALAVAQNSGIIEEKALLKYLGGSSLEEQGAVRFFLNCLNDLVEYEIKGELKYSFAGADFKLADWRMVKNEAVVVLKAQKEPLSGKELFAAIAQKNSKVEQKTFFDFLLVSQEILKNNFDKWGLANWKEISPKGTREKAYLILKEAGKPLHFKEIAKKIDEYKLSKKKTHPQTVHNELIKDKNFVLVGRGIYALAQWGYKKGTVKDVLEEIFKQSKKPLTREEVLKKVLEVRQVKKSTIVINLNNFFAKTKTGEYTWKK